MKSFFTKQETGAFVASHDMVSGFEPVFAELIEAVETRATQWQRIRAAGVDQRACHLFPSRAHLNEWQKQALEFFQAQARLG